MQTKLIKQNYEEDLTFGPWFSLPCLFLFEMLMALQPLFRLRLRTAEEKDNLQEWVLSSNTVWVPGNGSIKHL